jgi:hypothetical protein
VNGDVGREVFSHCMRERSSVCLFGLAVPRRRSGIQFKLFSKKSVFVFVISVQHAIKEGGEFGLIQLGYKIVSNGLWVG